MMCVSACHYAVCHYDVCRYAVCHYDVCRYAECRGASKGKIRNSDEFHFQPCQQILD